MNNLKTFFCFSLFLLAASILKIVELPENKNIFIRIEANKEDINSLNDPRSPKLVTFQYFKNINFPSNKELRHASGRPLGFDRNFFLNLLANFKVLKDQEYEIIINSDDGYRLFIDNNLIGEFTSDRPASEEKHSILLKSGEHNLSLDYFQGFGNAALQAKYRAFSEDKFNFIGDNSPNTKFIPFE